jgi:hypothetical protein
MGCPGFIFLDLHTNHAGTLSWAVCLYRVGKTLSGSMPRAKLLRRWGAACLIGMVVAVMVYAKVTRQAEPETAGISLKAGEKIGD